MLGVSAAELEVWPEAKIARYLVVMTQVAQYENAQRELESRKTSSPRK